MLYLYQRTLRVLPHPSHMCNESPTALGPNGWPYASASTYHSKATSQSLRVGLGRKIHQLQASQ